MKRIVRQSVCTSLAVLGAATIVHAQFSSPQNEPSQGNSPPQSPATESAEPSPPTEPVVATVNGDKITKMELDAAVQRQTKVAQIPADAVPQVRTQVLNHLVESRLVEQHVTATGPSVAPDEVESAVDNYAKQLQTQGLKFEDFLASRGYSERAFQRRIHGSLAWRKYQQQELTEEKLQQHFQQNQSQFDGTELAQVRDDVARSYVSVLWKDIVKKEAPKAQIEVTDAEKLQPPATQPEEIFNP